MSLSMPVFTSTSPVVTPFLVRFKYISSYLLLYSDMNDHLSVSMYLRRFALFSIN